MSEIGSVECNCSRKQHQVSTILSIVNCQKTDPQDSDQRFPVRDVDLFLVFYGFNPTRTMLLVMTDIVDAVT